MSSNIFRQKILSLIQQVDDPSLREHLEQSLKLYLRTRSIIEKKIYRERIITFYSAWLNKRGINPKEKKMLLYQLRRLLLALRK